jgi:hypothetical protein
MSRRQFCYVKPGPPANTATIRQTTPSGRRMWQEREATAGPSIHVSVVSGLLGSWPNWAGVRYVRRGQAVGGATTGTGGGLGCGGSSWAHRAGSPQTIGGCFDRPYGQATAVFDSTRRFSMATGSKTPSDQIDELARLVENALDSLRQVHWALQALKARLDDKRDDPS